MPRQEIQTTIHKLVNPITVAFGEVGANVQESNQRVPLKAVSQTLDDLFPEQAVEDKEIQELKKILGTTSELLTRDELKTTAAEIKYLVNTWLDDFERESFDGQTLKELLHEKGHL